MKNAMHFKNKNLELYYRQIQTDIKCTLYLFALIWNQQDRRAKCMPDKQQVTSFSALNRFFLWNEQVASNLVFLYQVRKIL